jgi:hypothetical protein
MPCTPNIALLGTDIAIISITWIALPSTTGSWLMAYTYKFAQWVCMRSLHASDSAIATVNFAVSISSPLMDNKLKLQQPTVGMIDLKYS